VEFPPDHRRPATRTFAGASLPITLTDELVVELRKLGAGEGATLFMTLLTAFCCLLHRHAGERDVVIGSPIAGRTRPELEPLIGAFVNMLAFRTTVDPMCTARELLAQVRDSTLDAYAHQDLPFELVVEALRPDRSLDHEPVFQNVLVLQNAPLPPLELAGLRVEHVPMPATYAKFDLMVTLRETGDGAVGTIEYATDLFTPDTVARIGRHYVAILEKIAAMPDRPVAELELLSGKEIELVTRQWAHGTAGSADGESIPARIGVVAAARPREPAILSAVDSADRVTFGELETWSNQLGHALAARGIGPESRVGVCLDRSPATLVLLLAILKAGAAYVPLDPAYPLPRLRFMLEDAAVDLVVVEDVHRHRLGEIHTGQVELTELWRDRGGFPDAPLDRVLAPAQPAYLLYTSGSTGTPKGVLGLHGGMVNRLRWMWRTHPFAPGEVACQKTSLNFLDSFWEVFGPLGQGVPVVVVPQPALTDPHVLVGMLAAHRVSRLVLVPSLLRTLLDTVPDLAARLPALRFWVSSGEPLTADLAARFLAVLPGRDLLNLYGASEVSADVTGHLIRQSDVDSESIPLGRPIAGTAVYVLDELLRPVPPGTVGDLYVGGVALARGYAGRPDLTAERFLPDPFSRQPGGLLYRTGDRGRFRADGAVEYAGRYDHQVKVRGFRVEPAEVENVLIAHTDVVEAVVSAEDDVLVAYCVAAPGAAIDAEVLRTHLRSILPAFMVPSMFVARTALPLTPSGKVDRTALRRNELGPDELRALSRSVVTAPRDEAERSVLRLLREVLGADHEIGVHDNFWLFGGHSLLATRFVARVRESFDARFTLEQFFLDPTVVGVVAALRAGRRAGLPGGPVLMAKPDRRQAPLSYPQRQLWLFEQMFPGTGAYNVPAAVRLSGPLDEQALRAALDTVVSRHAVLRSVFVQAGEEPEQRIEPVGTYEFTRHDLRRAADQERSARELAAAVSARPFDLAAGPLLRADVIMLPTGEHLLVLTMHHIVGDAWSWAVLLHEVSTVYAAAARGAAAPALPPLPLQYGDVAQWQRDRVRSGELDRQLDYWRARLADAPPVLELPTDRPRPAAPGFLGATVDFELDEADVAGLRTLAGQESATLFMAVLSVFDVLLHRYSGRTDFIVGTSVASRGQPEVEPMIGCLVNTVMVRANVAGAHTFRGVLRSVRDSAAGALANQDVPFETIVDRLRPPRAAPSAPHFQIMLTLRAAARLDLMDELLPSPFSVHNGTSKRDLTLNLVEDGATVSAQIEYNTALFEHDRVVRMADHFRRLLAAAVAGPDTPVGRLPMLTETEQVVVAELRDTAVAYPDAGTCVHELFQRQAERTPAAVAVRFEESTLTYTELARHASRLAHLLRGRGVGPETPVGLCLPPSLSMVVAVLGVLSAGGAYVPIDPRDPLDRQHAILRDAGARVVVRHPTDMAWRDAPYDSVALDDTWSTIDGYPDVPPPTLAEPANAAYVLYTSGSTGASKGVVVEHRQVVNYVLAVLDRLGISEPLGYAMVQPLTVDSCVTMLVPPLVTGGVLHVIARDRALDADRLAEYFSAHPVDCLKIAPSHLRALRQSGRGADLLPRRALVVGGEAADWRWLRALADDAGECAVHNHYGPTEATVGVLTFSVTGHTEPDAVTAPLGRPLPNTRAVVLDHDGRQVPVGVPGELYVGGANVARGYLGRPDLTAEAFVPDPAGGLLYRTGDVVRLRIDGAVEFLGRRDDQVKIRGYRVELGEIEATLGSAPDVRAAVAAVRADGPGEPRLIGYVVPVTGRRVDQAALRTFLRERLPAHMVPSALVELTELPLSAHGKVDRRALPAPAGDATVRVRPRTDVERTIAGVWSELLGVEHVGVEENFFDLGGHSLLLIGLHQRLQAALGTRFELVQLFRFSTVRAQAGLVTDEAGAIGVDDAKQRGRRQSEPLRRQRRRKRGHTDG
jgi:amino acid adenylation domain-containing protein